MPLKYTPLEDEENPSGGQDTGSVGGGPPPADSNDPYNTGAGTTYTPSPGYAPGDPTDPANPINQPPMNPNPSGYDSNGNPIYSSTTTGSGDGTSGGDGVGTGDSTPAPTPSTPAPTPSTPAPTQFGLGSNFVDPTAPDPGIIGTGGGGSSSGGGGSQNPGAGNGGSGPQFPSTPFVNANSSTTNLYSTSLPAVSPEANALPQQQPFKYNPINIPRQNPAALSGAPPAGVPPGAMANQAGASTNPVLRVANRLGIPTSKAGLQGDWNNIKRNWGLQ